MKSPFSSSPPSQPSGWTYRRTVPPPQGDAAHRDKGTSAAKWALLGVALGFLLPLCGLGALMLMCATSFQAALPSPQVAPGGQPELFIAAGSRPYVLEHVSGPYDGPAIAVWPMYGPIISTGDKTALSTNIIADYVVRVAQDLNEHEDVRALVLHINSPGGGVVASDRIYHALKNLDRPIVVYMDEIAASGGYYISMASDYIVANPNTLTGSIGVIAVFYNAEGLMEKIGVEPEVIKAGQAKDMGSIYRALTPAERAYLADLLQQVHENFIRIVAVNRELPTQQVRALADGRIYLASDARDKGLIDRLGYLEDAIREAGHRANLKPPYRVVRIRMRTSVLDELFSLAGPNMPTWQRWALEPTTWPWQQHPAPVLLYLWMP